MTVAGGATPTPVRPSAASGTDGGSATPNPAEGFADGPPPPTPYHPPVKRSVTIAGHETSISLEPIFWSALDAEASRHGLPLNALIARIDADRVEVRQPPNLASALRCWLFENSSH